VTKARLSSVANSIRLLTSFSGEEDELGITTLASQLRLVKSTVHRLEYHRRANGE
jgi:DNA-binding IclR family transcriptional regulator